MKFYKVEGEITAQAYKRLMVKLKGLNKNQLLACFDHYFCHVIETKHVDEFLKILSEFEDCTRLSEYDPVAPRLQVAAQAETEGFIEPTMISTDTDGDTSWTPRFQDTLTEKEIEANKDFLDLMYDRTYFDAYLYPEAQKTVAQKLIDYTTKNELPVQPHWKLYIG